MAVLNSWQRIDYVIPGKPFGDGKDGIATVSSDPNVRMTVTGTDTEFTSTVGATTLTNGDLVKIIQFYGTGAGNWQYNMVASGGGSTSITWTKPLHYTFVTGAQCVKLPRYSSATVAAHSATAYNGSINGIEEIVASVSCDVSGAWNGNGGNGSVGQNAVSGGTGGGFRGGTATSNGFGAASSGDGTDGLINVQSAARGNGGGGGTYNQNGGGGGGNGGGGTTGENKNAGSPGVGGSVSGSADLLSMVPGGGGGGGCKDSAKNVSSGGSGGAVLSVVSPIINFTAATTVNGGTSPGCSDAEGACGGGGAGGSILLVCITATGLNNLTALAGGANTTGAYGGAGGVGRIAVHHSGAITGTSNPAFTDISDPTLKESGGGSILLNFL